MNSLVTVIVVTYNSSPLIVETLESVSQQTWKDLELIITDDCSRDDTVEVCSNWLNKNRKRFVRPEILISERNTGIPANANRGLHCAKGDWMCFLAGDDTLKPKCIEDNMIWIASQPEIKVLFSQMDVYKDTFEFQNYLKTTPLDPYNTKSIMAPGRSAQSQYKMLLLCDRIHYTPSVFLNRVTLLSIGGFDERFKLLEDYPLWLKLTMNNHKLYFMDKVTVNYRQHSTAINNTGHSFLVNPNYFRQEDFRRLYTYPYLPADIRYSNRYDWYISQIFRCNCLNKNNKQNRFLLAFLTTYMNPFKYIIYIRKRRNKNLENSEFYK
jgi:alpha-1,3-rhamnosyltransferase